MCNERHFTAIVRMIIEVEHHGPWGEECTLKQVEDQARREGGEGFLNAMEQIELPYHCRVSSCHVESIRIQREQKR